MQTTVSARRIINHKRMRQVIGVIAVLLGPVVGLLSGDKELDSISASYWSDARDVFVGSLITVGFFLSAYNGTGTGKDLEYLLSRLAFGCAVCVALFPTQDITGGAVPPQWVQGVSSLLGTTSQKIHYTTAVTLFACLISMMWFFSCRARAKGKIGRSRGYRSISLGMLFGMPVAYYIGQSTGLYQPVYGVEQLGLFLFGVGWFWAGSYTTEKEEEKTDEGHPLNQSLKVNEFIKVEVDPRKFYVVTNLRMKPGEKYYFQASGKWRDWFLQPCGPEGWGPWWNPLAIANRKRWQPFFVLCGSIGRDDSHTFTIGKDLPWAVPDEVETLEDSDLYLFANDWLCGYWNNKALSEQEGGPLIVTITRLL